MTRQRNSLAASPGAGPRHAALWAGGLVLLLLAAAVVALAWTPSHFAVALTRLGFTSTGLVAGIARPIRSDDYAVATALIRNVVENRFAATDAVSPYHEPFRSFVASPILDWSLAFKPQFWGFLLLGPARALSFFFVSFQVSFIAGYVLLLRRFGVPPVYALVVSLTLLSSQLVQVWWTQRAPLYAFAPWPLVIFTSRWPERIRLPALAYATAVWLFGEFYPPAIIGTGFAWAVLTLAFARRDFASREGLVRGAAGLAAILVGLAVVGLYFSGVIPIMRDTVYPGQRISGGGGVPWPMLAAHIFPYAAVWGVYPILDGTNECDIGTVGTFLPLMLLVFGRSDSLRNWIAGHRLTVLLWSGGLGLMLAWLVLPLPPVLGMAFLWDRVPANRLLWGFGVLLTLGCAKIAAEVEWRLSPFRLLVFAILVAAAYLCSKALWIEPGSAAALAFGSNLARKPFKAWDLAVLLPVLLVAGSSVLLPRGTNRHARLLLGIAGLLAGLATFGTYNPIQSATSIFTPDSTPFLDAARTLARANPRGWAAEPGLLGGTLNAFGVPSIVHVLSVPDLPFFRALYPAMPDADFDAIFNRYAHVQVGFEAEPVSPQRDVIVLPIFDVGTPLRVRQDIPLPTGSPEDGMIEDVTADLVEGRGWRVLVRGWVPFRGIAPNQSLLLHATGGSVSKARAVRMISTAVGTARQDRAYDTAGFALEVYLDPDADGTAFDPRSLDVGAVDEGGAIYRLPRR